MAIIETKTYVCDGCGRQSEEQDFCDHQNSGRSTLRMNGGRGSRNFNGDWGGMNHTIEMLLCFDCADTVRAHLNELKSK